MKANFKDFEQTVKCLSCHKALIHYIIVDESDETMNSLQVNCPFCEDETPIIKIKGKLHYGPIGYKESMNPTQIIDIKNKGNNLWYLMIRKKK